MEITRKLRKFIRRRFTTTAADHRDDDDNGADTKLRRILRQLRKEDSRSTNSGELETYGAVLSLLLKHSTGDQSQAEPTDGGIGRGSFCDDCHRQGAASTEPTDNQLSVTAAQKILQPPAGNLPNAESMLKVSACCMSRSSQDTPFGMSLISADRNVRLRSIIDQIEPNSPAAIAGLTVGDKILAINGRILDDEDDADGLISDLLEAKLVVERMRRDRYAEEEATCDDEDSEPVAPTRPSIFSEAELRQRNRQRLRGKSDEMRSIDFDSIFDRSAGRYPGGTIMDRFPEARAFLRLMGRGTYSDEFRDCNIVA